MALYWPAGKVALEFVEEVPEGGPYPPDTLVLTAAAEHAHDPSFARDLHDIVLSRVIRHAHESLEDSLAAQHTGGGEHEGDAGDAAPDGAVAQAEADFERTLTEALPAGPVEAMPAGPVEGRGARDAGVGGDRTRPYGPEDLCAEVIDELMWAAEQSLERPCVVFDHCDKVVIRA